MIKDILFYIICIIIPICLIIYVILVYTVFQINKIIDKLDDIEQSNYDIIFIKDSDVLYDEK